MRSDHIPDHDRRIHRARCFKCGQMYNRTDGCDCEDEDAPMDWETYKKLKGLEEV